MPDSHCLVCDTSPLKYNLCIGCRAILCNEDFANCPPNCPDKDFVQIDKSFASLISIDDSWYVEFKNQIGKLRDKGYEVTQQTKWLTIKKTLNDVKVFCRGQVRILKPVRVHITLKADLKSHEMLLLPTTGTSANKHDPIAVTMVSRPNDSGFRSWHPHKMEGERFCYGDGRHHFIPNFPIEQTLEKVEANVEVVRAVLADFDDASVYSSPMEVRNLKTLFTHFSDPLPSTVRERPRRRIPITETVPPRPRVRVTLNENGQFVTERLEQEQDIVSIYLSDFGISPFKFSTISTTSGSSQNDVSLKGNDQMEIHLFWRANSVPTFANVVPTILVCPDPFVSQEGELDLVFSSRDVNGQSIHLPNVIKSNFEYTVETGAISIYDSPVHSHLIGKYFPRTKTIVIDYDIFQLHSDARRYVLTRFFGKLARILKGEEA